MEPSHPKWNPLVPELTVRDLKRSLDFYGCVGFTVRFKREDPPFAYLELGGAQIMLEEENGSDWTTAPLEVPFGRGINFQIEVPSAIGVRDALVRSGYTVFREPRERWFEVSDEEEGQIEVLAHDPDGYLLRLAEILGARPRRQ